ncbi:MAG: hypothetical protein ACFCGT_11470 [Sandaracinaceae bacterium]
MSWPAPRRWAAARALAGLLLLVGAAVAPHVPAVDPRLAYIVAFVVVVGTVLLASACTPRLTARGLLVVGVSAAVLAAVGALGSALPGVVPALVVTLALLAGGTAAGGVIGRAVQDAGHLLPVAVLSALVDAGSVFHPQGVTAQVVRSETMVHLLALPWALAGTPDVVPILGVGDIAFTALYVAASRRHGLSVRRTLVALAAGYAATLAVLVVTGMPLPALPFLGAAVVVAHPEARRLRARDRRTAAIGIGAVAVLVLALLLLR